MPKHPHLLRSLLKLPGSFRPIVYSLLLLVGAWPLGPVAPTTAAPPVQASTPADLQAFQLVAPEAGWVLFDQRLHWTDDNGLHWRDLTPAAVGPAYIAAADFADARHGWLVTVGGAETDPAYQLYTTTDGGATWHTTPLSLFAPGEPGAQSSAVYLDFIDANLGWLVVKQATSRAFSLGTLFRTTDGGATWTRLALPAGAPVQFSTPQDGVLMADPPARGHYVTHDGGASWALDTEPVAPPSTGGVSELTFATTTAGWGRSAAGQCDEHGCELTVQLVRTADSGQTWTPVPLPNGQTTLTRAYAAPASGAAAEATDAQSGLALSYTGHGFDSCPRDPLGAAFLSAMQTWVNQSPYRVWNLYIGGTSVANCGTLTANVIHQLSQQGWLFIPTWVGPQAPCSGFGRRMSGDPATAYQQGVIEAHLAMDRVAALRLAVPGQQSTVIYYDLEAYSGQATTACRDAVKSFMSGWTATLHAHGHVSGVYGSPCGSFMNDLSGLAHVPDQVWLAAWTQPYFFDPQATVWNVACLSNSLWTQGQRLRQYTGGHDETWGGATFNIDSDVIGGMVSLFSGNCLPGAGQVALFVYPNYGGQCVLKDLGDYPTHETLGPVWDQVSSVRVGANVRLTLCEHIHFGGVCQDFFASNTDLADDAIGDNAVSSIRVQPHTPALTRRAWLPVLHVSPVVTSGLPNGHFENGPTLWSTSSAQGLNLIVPNPTLQAAGVNAHGGTWAAWLGGAHAETGTLQQTITVPPDAPLLHYWHWVKSAETGCYYDIVSVWVNSSVVESYGLCGDSGGWVPYWIDLSAYRGSNVTLRFQVTTDTSLTSSVFIDDLTWRSRP